MHRILAGRSSRDSVRITTEGGSSFFTRPEYLERAGIGPSAVDSIRRLCAGGVDGAVEAMDIGDDLEDALDAAGNAWVAEKRAASLLARSEQSRYMVGTKLAARGFAPVAASMALDRLESLGLLDDARFAAAWVESRIRRSADGPDAVVAGLRSRGIDPELARSTVENLFDRDARLLSLNRALAKAARRSTFDPDRTRAKLLRQGFSRAEVDDGLQRLKTAT
ncbi:MAG: regulatory protein RecX [Spirochaetes bacterium]|nr:regulatory protein RecX [Spirochaetota bacterium]